jgi:hypothetical protein
MKNSKRKLTIRVLSVLAGVALSLASWAGQKNPLHVKGYQAAVNVNDFASEPGVAIHVQFDGEGGVAHLGKMTSHSEDQRGDLATGVLTATVTFTDSNGDDLVVSSLGFSEFQPDFRITFSGQLTVIGGTGRFSNASGQMSYEGWARITDMVASTGIGFFTFEGDLNGISVMPEAAFTTQETGSAVFDGVNFVYKGSGNSSHFGKFTDVVQTEPQPFEGQFNGAFMGIVDGRIVLISSFVNEWTHPNGTKLLSSGIEFVSFALTPGGDPDFTQPSIADVYQTIDGGTGRFAEAEGVLFETGYFVPTAPQQVSAQVTGHGFVSLPGK